MSESAWHAVEHSWEAYGIEVCQPTIDRPYKEGHYKNLVTVCVPYVKAGIPVVHLPTLEWADGRRGFVGHEETEQGLRDGKSDPGPPFDRAKFIHMLKAETEEEMTPAEFKAMLLADADFQAVLKKLSQVDRNANEALGKVNTHAADLAKHAGGKHDHGVKATLTGRTEENG